MGDGYRLQHTISILEKLKDDSNIRSAAKKANIQALTLRAYMKNAQFDNAMKLIDFLQAENANRFESSAVFAADNATPLSQLINSHFFKEIRIQALLSTQQYRKALTEIDNLISSLADSSIADSARFALLKAQILKARFFENVH